MFLDVFTFVADYIDPRGLYITSLTCKDCQTTAPMRKACLQRAVAKYTQRDGFVRRNLFRVYSPHGTHCLTINVLNPDQVYVYHEPSKFQDFVRTTYWFRRLLCFSENGSLSAVHIRALLDSRFVATLSGIYVRDVTMRFRRIHFVLVVTRVGVPDLTLAMRSKLGEETFGGGTHYV